MIKHKIENSGHGHCIAMLPDGACHRPIHFVLKVTDTRTAGFWRHNPIRKINDA